MKRKKKKRIKGKKGLEKTCIHDKYNSPSTKAPTGNTMHPWLSLYPMSGHPFATSPHLHGLDDIPWETFLFLWILAQ
jgi:hypothetical protein